MYVIFYIVNKCNLYVLIYEIRLIIIIIINDIDILRYN